MKISDKKLKNIVTAVAIIIAVAVFVIGYIRDYKKKFPKENEFISDDYVEFFDVGQGDCALISSNGKNCLIDTGTSSCTKELISKLNKRDIDNFDLITLSHFHVDHTGSILSIVKKFSIDNLIYPPELKDSKIPKAVDEARQECLASDGEFYVGKAGQTVTVGDFKLSVLYLNTRFEDENNRSIYIMAKSGDKKFFFTGDGEKECEREILNQNLNISCDVLKVAHHGGSGSSTDEFLRAANPECAVISCGEGNMYGHPHQETLDRLKKHNIKTYRTDLDGDIVFYIDNGELSVTTQK